MKLLNYAHGLSGRSFPVIILTCLLLLVLSACNLYESAENRSSDKAKKEKAAIYIDNGDYDKAFDILNKMYLKDQTTTDARLLQLLSNASSGKIGLDTFNILEVADDLADGDTSGGIDLVGKVLGNEQGFLTKSDIEDKLFELQGTAIPVLEQIGEKMTEDHHAQLGLLSIIDTVLTVGEIIMEDKARDNIELTEEGIKNLYGDSGFEKDHDTEFQEFVRDKADNLNENIRRIEKSIDAIASLSGATEAKDNDLSEIFDEFLEETTDLVLVEGQWERQITYESLDRYIRSL